MKHEEYSFFATCAKGMESLLSEEIREIRAQDVEEVQAGVMFKGALEVGYRACLYSRIANRILLVLKTVRASDADQLYDGAQQIFWPDHLAVENTFAIDFLTSHSTKNAQIKHTHFGALKVKDAIVDQFRAAKGDRPSVNPMDPDLRINVYLNGNTATISLDLSGESLHKRGYRALGITAPLKENLAAAILMLSGLNQKEGMDFIDPMCGSGTLPIEAALMRYNIAPGLLRKSFGFSNWLGHVSILWQRLLQEAKERVIKHRLEKIIGYDQDPVSIQTALSNLENTGLKNVVHFEQREIGGLEAVGPKGILVVNPPYGERLGEVEELKILYRRLGDLMKQRFSGWEGYIFTSNPELAKSVGLKTSRRFILYNGSLECRLLKYDLY